MRIYAASIAVFLAVASMVFAEDVKLLPSPTAGDVSFSHKKHQEIYPLCTPCHKDNKGGEISSLKDKKSAHNLCVSCHETKKVTHTKCAECHKKVRKN